MLSVVQVPVTHRGFVDVNLQFEELNDWPASEHHDRKGSLGIATLPVGIQNSSSGGAIVSFDEGEDPTYEQS